MSIANRIEKDYCLKALSTFGIGGKARYFISIHTIEEMQELAHFIYQKKLSYWVVGKGSNSLFDDRGFDGIVILNKIDFISMDLDKLEVGAGYSFSRLGAQTARKGWGGLEFASGIPGTVGGAIYMNAGANGMETQDSLIAVSFVDEKGSLIEKSKHELSFSYRTSSFQETKGIIVSACFELFNKPKAREEQLEIVSYRIQTQPYGKKSAGCVFRNPSDRSAGALIEECGLKGKKIGGAEVSSKHANFIVNVGEATAQDVLKLAHLLKETILRKTGQELEMEIHPVPYQLKGN